MSRAPVQATPHAPNGSRHRVMREALDELRAGRITFPEFQVRTLAEWRRVATWLLRRWDTPDGVEESDVVQELLLASWRFVREWDPAKGTTLSGYVVWNSCDKAKKWIHTQRRAARRDDSAPSRHPVSFSSLNLEDWQEERLAVVLPTADAQLETNDVKASVAARLTLVAPRLSQLDCYALAVLVDAVGDVDEAARDLWDDPSARLAFRLSNEGSAVAAVRGVIHRTRDALESTPR